MRLVAAILGLLLGGLLLVANSALAGATAPLVLTITTVVGAGLVFGGALAWRWPGWAALAFLAAGAVAFADGYRPQWVLIALALAALSLFARARRAPA